MATIEQRELKGITIRNLLVTIVSTASIVASVITTYWQLKTDVHEIKITQEAQNRVSDIRLKYLETQLALLQQQMEGIKTGKTTAKPIKPYLTINH